MTKRRRRSEAEIAAVVAGYEQSGLSRRAYCERRGLAVATLDYYRRRGKGAMGLVAVEVEGRSTSSTLTVVLSNGRRIEVSGEFVESELARLLRTVERA